MIRDDDLVRLQQSQNALRTGQIGEHVVCADIMLSGFEAHLASQGCTYDVVADTGSRLLRVQVKTVCFALGATDRDPAYTWNTQTARRSRYEGIDAFALVALDGPHIGYIPASGCGMKVRLSPPGTPLELRRGSPMRSIGAFPFIRLVEDFNAAT